MIQPYKTYLLTLLMLLCGSLITLQAQSVATDYTLQADESGASKAYVARDYISMKPGFRYAAANGTTFNAKIDRGLLFPPTDATYLKPDGSTTSDPTQGVAVGSIPGQFEVSPTGAATYTIPIACPQGINGMQPDISLTYNSQGGNGIAGWGWSIGGLSMITRMPKNHYYDAEKTGIIWDKTSPLALDGQRLIKIQEWGTDSILYETESKSGNRILGYNVKDWGPECFKIYTKAGQTITYGNPNNLASYYPLKKEKTPTIDIFENFGWAIVSVVDNNQNIINYAYTSNEVHYLRLGQTYIEFSNVLLDNISYGGNLRENKSNDMSVKFEYSNLPSSNIVTTYLDGKETTVSKILDKIKVISNNAVVDTYTVAYNVSENKYYLTNVSLFNQSNEKLPPTKVEWNQGAYTNSGVVDMTFDSYPSHNQYCTEQGYGIEYFVKIFGDIDGDGLTDVVAKMTYKKGDDRKYYWVVFRKVPGNNQYRFVYEKQWNKDKEPSFLLFDNDHDGKDELIILSMTTDHLKSAWIDSYMYENSTMKYKRIASFTNSDVYDNRDKASLIPIDIQGDGESEFLVTYSNNKLLIINSASVVSTLPFGGDDNSCIYFTDINGNGRTEIMYIKDNTTTFYEYDNASAQFKSIYSSSPFYFRDKIYTGDFNGDGNTDFFVRKYNSPRNQIVYLSDGASLTQTVWADNIVNSSVSHSAIDYNGTAMGAIYIYQTRMMLDLNQDGRTDIVTCHFPNSFSDSCFVNVYISTGNGFEKKATFGFPTWYTLSEAGKFGSVSEKGIILWNTKYSYEFSRISLSSNVIFSKIATIDNGLISKKITYQNVNLPRQLQTTLGDKYLNDFGITHSLPTDFEAVSSSQTVDKNNAVHESLGYSFSNPVTHWKGRGFLGFKNTQVTNSMNLIASATEYKLDSTFFVLYPFKNLSKTTSGVTISQNISDYTAVNYGNKRYFLKLNSQISTDYLTGMSTQVKYMEYDNWLNLKKIETTKGEMVETQTINYIQKGAWCPNKPQNVTTERKYQGINNDYSSHKEYEYDSRGNATRETTSYIPADERFKTITEYANFDNFGHARTVSIKAKDASGVEQTRTSTLAYTPSGRFVATKTNALGETTAFHWNETLGVLEYETDHYGRTTNYYYDSWSKLKETLHPDGTRTAKVLQWAGSGSPTGARYYSYEQSSGDAPVTAWYDPLGRELQKDTYGLKGRKVCVSTEYYTSGTNKGRLYRVSEPYFEGEAKTWLATYNSYDAYGRVTAITTPMGQETAVYNGLTTTSTTPEGTKVTKLNSSGLTESVTTNGKKVTYAYNPSGLTKTSTPEGGQSLSMEYDPQGNRTKLTDPDAGVVESRYDGFGQLVETKQKVHDETDYVTTTSNYNSLGLLQSVVRSGETTTYSYDGLNRLTGVAIAGKHKQVFDYDNLDRVTNLREEIDGRTYNRTTEYDALGRIRKDIYPSGYFTVNTYDSYGNLAETKDQAGRSIWKPTEENARGQMTKVSQGGRITTYGFDNRGLPTSMESGSIVSLEYFFNAKGNLQYRTDNLTTQREDFTYDGLNRLATWMVTKSGTQTSFTMGYNASGNIETKSDLGGFTLGYGANGKPHALTSVSGTPSGWKEQGISYTDFKKVQSISDPTNFRSYSLTYGVDDQRRKSAFTQYWAGANPGSRTTTRYYIGDYEEEITPDGNVRKIHYLSGAVLIRNRGVDSLLYTYSDYLGSLTALADENGNVVQRYAYDPWGKRRNPSDWTLADSRTSWVLNRGYTGHEHLDQFGVIDMGGRVYDPLTGQFFSPDPYISFPGDWVGYNRYLYAMGNPFRYTDPSGEFLGLVFRELSFIAELSSNLVHGQDDPLGNAWKQSGKATNAVAGAAQIPIYKDGHNLLTFGLDPFAIGVSANYTYTNGSNSVGVSAGIGALSGPYANVGASHNMGDWNLSAGAGVGDNYAGWNVSATYKGYGAGYGQTYYGSSEIDGHHFDAQTVGTFTGYFNHNSFSITNDLWGDKEDRWRTSSAELTIGDFSIGTYLYTNNGGKDSNYKQDESLIPPWPVGKNKNKGLSTWANGRVYRAPLWLGYRIGNQISRIGFSHRTIHNLTQNWVHKGFGNQNYYMNYDEFKTGLYLSSGYYNPFSLWEH